MSSTGVIQAKIDAGQKRAMALGFVGIVAFVIMGFVTKGGENGGPTWLPFFHGYLLAFVFWSAISVGSLAVLMIHHMTGGWWGFPLRRILEASTRTLPLMAVLFIPVIIGMGRIYSWTSPDPNDSFLAHKLWYLNSHGFILRAVIYFAIWILLSVRLNTLSAKEDRTGDPNIGHSMEVVSAPGLLIGAVTVSVAAIDWVMSLQPDWFSTIWGFLFIVIFILGAYSFAVFTFTRLAQDEPLKDAVEPSRYLDIGNLLLAFTILWTYLSFDQFLIIWAGNMKDEIPFYMTRAFGGWGVIAASLLVLHFFVPFFMLLQRRVKRRLPVLAKVALLQFVFTLVDLYWLIVPSYQSGPRLGDLEFLLAVVGIGGIWVALFLGQLKKMPLLPLHDPRFAGRATAIPPVSDFLHVHGRRPEA